VHGFPGQPLDAVDGGIAGIDIDAGIPVGKGVIWVMAAGCCGRRWKDAESYRKPDAAARQNRRDWRQHDHNPAPRRSESNSFTADFAIHMALLNTVGAT